MIFYSPELAARYLAHVADLGSTPSTGAAVAKAIATLDLTPQMAQFRFPVLVLKGRFDLNVTPDVSWAVAHNIPGRTTRLLRKERPPSLLRRTRQVRRHP